MTRSNLPDQITVISAAIFLLILPFRFVTNGLVNVFFGGVYSTIFPVVAICIFMIISGLRFKIKFDNIFIFILTLTFVFLLLINYNGDSAFSMLKSNQVSFMLPVYLLAPFTLCFIKSNNISFDQVNKLFIKCLNAFCVLTFFVCIIRIFDYQQHFGLFNFFDARYYLSIIRTPMEISLEGDLGVDSIPTGRTLALMIACVVLISDFNKTFKFIMCGVFLYVLVMIMNRQSLGAVLFIFFMHVGFIPKILIIAFCILLFLLFDTFVGFDNTRFLDGGGERSELWDTFFHNMDSLTFLGNGVNSFGKIYDYPDVYPHNFSMELLFEIGVFSYIIFVLAFVIFSARTGLGFNSSNMIKKYLTISIWYYFLTSNLSGDMFYNSVLLSLLVSYFILFPNTYTNRRACVQDPK